MRVSASSQEFAQNTLELVIHSNFSIILRKLVELKSNIDEKKSKLQSHNEFCANSSLKPKQSLRSSILLRQSHSKTINSKNAISIDCSKSPNNSNSIATKIQTKTDKKPYKCNKCEKKYSMPNSLRVHIWRYHSGSKEYSCNQCDKKFNISSSLKSHMRIHSGEKPFSCSKCDKKFNHSGHLTVHMRIHSGVRPFSCNICDKKFALSSNLTSHLKTHSGEKPYSCKQCEKKFSRSSTLKSHVLIHTRENPIVCNKSEND
jgi:KRAB domain-containing zinc finger protein